MLRDTKRTVALAREYCVEPHSWDILGTALYEVGEFAEAKLVFADHLRWAENNARPTAMVSLRSWLARTLWQAGDRDAARAELRQLEEQLRRYVICEISELDERDAAWRMVEGRLPPPTWSMPKTVK